MANVKVKVLTNLNHYGMKKAGDVIEVSELEATNLAKAGLVEYGSVKADGSNLSDLNQLNPRRVTVKDSVSDQGEVANAQNKEAGTPVRDGQATEPNGKLVDETGKTASKPTTKTTAVKTAAKTAAPKKASGKKGGR